MRKEDHGEAEKGEMGVLEGAAWYSPGLFGSGQGEVPCGSAELVPVSLARLLWLPERGLGRWGGPILGDSMLPPARDHELRWG